MIDSALLAVLMLLLIMGTCASAGWDSFEFRNRETWWWTCVLALEALLMDNIYAALLLGTVIIGLWQIGRSWYVLRMTIIPIAGCAGIYALVTPHLQLWMVPWMLWTGTAIGLFLAAWALLGTYITKRPFRFILPFKWCGFWGIYEDLDEGLKHLCGQAHPCHLNSICAFSMACAGGLIWIGQWWALPALLACYIPMDLTVAASKDKANHPHIGHLALLAAGIAGVALINLTSAGVILACSVIVGTAATLHFKPWQHDHPVYGKGAGWWDSGRLIYWKDVLTLAWWPSGWIIRLFGFGTCTWFAATMIIGETRHKQVYTSAHNEFLQQLVEHGVIGLAAMLLYIGEGFWRNLNGAPEQQAITLLIAAWCGVAAVHFPAVYMHEYHPSTEKKERWFGSPPLNVWSLVIAMLAEVR